MFLPFHEDEKITHLSYVGLVTQNIYRWDQESVWRPRHSVYGNYNTTFFGKQLTSNTPSKIIKAKGDF